MVTVEKPLCGLSCFKWSGPSQGVAKAGSVALEPFHPCFYLLALGLGSLKTQLGQEEMGNSATVESNSSSRHTCCSAGEGHPVPHSL